MPRCGRCLALLRGQRVEPQVGCPAVSPDDDRKPRRPGTSRPLAPPRPSKGAAHRQQAQRGRHGAGGDRANRKGSRPPSASASSVAPDGSRATARGSSACWRPTPAPSRSPTGSSRRGSTARPRASRSTCAPTACSRTTPRRSSRSGPTCATCSRRRCDRAASSTPTTSRRVRSTLALDRFLASVQPVHEFGKLGALVFPFPSYFAAVDQGRSTTSRGCVSGPATCRSRSSSAIATGSTRKHRDATMAFLTEHRLSYVVRRRAAGLPDLAAATRGRHHRHRVRAVPRTQRRRVGTRRRHRRRPHPLRLPPRRPRALGQSARQARRNREVGARALHHRPRRRRGARRPAPRPGAHRGTRARASAHRLAATSADEARPAGSVEPVTVDQGGTAWACRAGSGSSTR